MRLSPRTSTTATPTSAGPVRAGRPTRSLLPHLRQGDIAVLDHLDLDRATAQALLDAGVAAVVNAAPMISGRYPNLGPELLAAAGVRLVESLGRAGFEAIAAAGDGTLVELRDGGVYADGRLLAQGRELDADGVQESMERARAGMAAQLETFTHNTAELLRREQDVLLHRLGVPMLHTRIAGRPVVVVAPGPHAAAQVRPIRRFIREQRAVVVAVDTAADALTDLGVRSDVIVLSGPDGVPSAKSLRAAADVVVCRAAGGAGGVVDGLARMGIEALHFQTAITAEDAALLIADAAHPSLVVGAGLPTTLTDFLDRRHPGLAGTYLARLSVGQRLVDATAVPTLYTGAVRRWHLLLAVVAGLAMVAAAILTTATGQDWADQLRDVLSDLLGSARDLVLEGGAA